MTGKSGGGTGRSKPRTLPVGARLFDRTVLAHPALTLAVLGVPILFLLASAGEMQMDATSDSIVLENDADLRFYDETRRTYGGDDELFVVVTPEGELFSRPVIDRVARLADELAEVPGVASVTSLATVPLFSSPPVGLLALAEGYRTLSDPGTDLALAREEVLSSPLYADALVDEAGRTTAIQVVFERSERLAELEAERYELWELRGQGSLAAESRRRLAELDRGIRELTSSLASRRRAEIARVREVVAGHRTLGEIEIGGLPLITADIVRYIETDIVVFGVAVVVFVLVCLAILFRSWKWTLLPTAVSVLAVLAMVGLLGRLEWHTTIVTSNFTSLLLIITVAMVIHIVVRFRENQARRPEASNRELMLSTARGVARPCLYTALTTIVGFGSLYVSHIRPVMDFARMMAIGIAVSYAFAFLLLPALNALIGRGPRPPESLSRLDYRSPFTALGEAAVARPRTVVAVSAAVAVVGLLGALRLDVENRFIDYFKESSEIHRGMVYIDRHLGGTTPLEVVLRADEPDAWLDAEDLKRLREIHGWLEAQPETGKVVSLDSLVRVLEKIISEDPNPLVRSMVINRATLGMLRGRIPEEVARQALRPYVSSDYSEARIALRVRESDPTLRRKELLARIDSYLDDEAPLDGIRARATGMFVLYNNMLQSLFRSQIQTIGAVFLAVWLMFLVLFRSVKLATVTLIPNLLPVLAILGALGWSGVPLDMMTIMTAAVTLGIAVDDTIHFVHRFREEFSRDRSYRRAMVRSLNSVGRAMVYTSVTIIAGFSVLTLSRFIPTVLFGIFTAVAMTVALAAAVMLLPVLLLLMKPLGPEG